MPSCKLSSCRKALMLILILTGAFVILVTVAIDTFRSEAEDVFFTLVVLLMIPLCSSCTGDCGLGHWHILHCHSLKEDEWTDLKHFNEQKEELLRKPKSISETAVDHQTQTIFPLRYSHFFSDVACCMFFECFLKKTTPHFTEDFFLC